MMAFSWPTTQHHLNLLTEFFLQIFMLYRWSPCKSPYLHMS